MKDAPDFSLPDQTGTLRTLQEFTGKWVLLYFYPKDNTPGCTKEACDFRDRGARFAEAGIQILGCSRDSIKSHAKFAEKHNLRFPLLSDSSNSTHLAYGACIEKGFLGKPSTLRNSYLIDPNGSIIKEYHKVNPLTHVNQILKDFAEIQS